MAGVAFNGSYGKEYSRLRSLTSTTDVIQQSVGKTTNCLKILNS